MTNAYLAATKTKREEILGRQIFEVFPDNPNDKDATGVRNLRTSLERVVETAAPDTMAVQKYDIRRPEEEGGGFEERFWSPINSPVFDSERQVKFIIHRVEDVTEFIQLKQRDELATELLSKTHAMEAEIYSRAQEVQQTNQQLQAANKELARLYDKTRSLEQLKSNFFANVSHELRTPLTLIIGPAENLRASPRMEEPLVRSFLDVIIRNANLVLKHVNDLLDASKLEAGRMEFVYEEADLAVLLRRQASYFESLAAERNIKLIVDAVPQLLAELDPQKIERVLINLLSNAFKFTPPGGTVRCSLKVEADTVIIEIADSGPGIPPDFREAAFERFRRLDHGSGRRIGGTGLGLAIVRELIELHRGEVLVGDAPEGGALFTLKLPRKAAPGVVVEHPESTVTAGKEDALREILTLRRQQPVEETPTGRREAALVLVVEDNRDLNRFIRENLSEFRVASAFDGKEGWEKAMTLRPDIIVTDMMMPEMTGDLLVEAIRKNPEFNTTPILVLTAKADDELRVKVLRSGAQDYVTKPFSAAELHARVSNLIATKMANDRIQKLNAELNSAFRELEAFSYTVSHDLRAPLRAVKSFSEILKEEHSGEMSAEAQAILERVIISAKRMQRLIDDLLRLSMVSSRGLNRDTVNIQLLVQEVVDDFRKEPQNRGVVVSLQDLPETEADPSLLKQVFVNLISNAFKFSRARPGARIEIGADPRDTEVIYFVRDNGAGFNAARSEKLFVPFQRFHAEQDFDGSGIGLSIVKRIIQRHSGRVWAESEVNKGATFYISIPYGNSGRHS